MPKEIGKVESTILVSLAAVIPQLTEFQKGKLLGYAEAKAEDRREEKKSIA